MGEGGSSRPDGETLLVDPPFMAGSSTVGIGDPFSASERAWLTELTGMPVGRAKHVARIEKIENVAYDE